jgi:heat shock protein HtpX
MPFFALLATAVCLFAVFLILRRSEALIAGQAVTTSAIIMGFISMSCPMFQWIWAYVGAVSFGLFTLSVVRFHLIRREQVISGVHLPCISKLEAAFEIPIRIIDSQKMRAFAHRRAVYLSIGLLERLDCDELMAVVAHEAYHVKHSPSKLVSSVAALASLTFVPFNDERSADQYAVSMAGRDALRGALEKLEISGCDQRLEALLSVPERNQND